MMLSSAVKCARAGVELALEFGFVGSALRLVSRDRSVERSPLSKADPSVSARGLAGAVEKKNASPGSA